jgi:AmiR/NasT family two-component response regulator
VPQVGYKIFIGTAHRPLRNRLKLIFQQRGYTVIGEAEDSPACLRIIRRLMPDLVILDQELPGIPGIDVAKIIAEDKLAPVILLTPTWEKTLFDKAKDSWIFAFLVKPIQEGHLLSTAAFVLHTFHKMQKLEKQVDSLKESLETRKIVEKAKGILMEKDSLTEGEAYKRMRQQSMDRCISLKQVAGEIISAFEKSQKEK